MDRQESETIDLERIKGMGLLAVKVGQILALRPDLLPPERCLELQGLYQRTHTKHAAPLSRLMAKNCPEGFADHFASIEEEPMAAASIGQVHAATLLDGREVVIKFVKDDFEEPFRKDVARMKRWLSAVLFFSPRLRKVGNPMALLNHIETYTLDELDLRNERRGQIRLQEAIESVKDDFPLERLRFPEIHTDISSERVLVVERVREPSIEDRIDDGSLGWEDLLQLFRIQEPSCSAWAPSTATSTQETRCWTRTASTPSSTPAPFVKPQSTCVQRCLGSSSTSPAVTSTRPSSPCWHGGDPPRVQNWTVTCGTCISCTTGLWARASAKCP